MSVPRNPHFISSSCSCPLNIKWFLDRKHPQAPLLSRSSSTTGERKLSTCPRGTRLGVLLKNRLVVTHTFPLPHTGRVLVRGPWVPSTLVPRSGLTLRGHKVISRTGTRTSTTPRSVVELVLLLHEVVQRFRRGPQSSSSVTFESISSRRLFSDVIGSFRDDSRT